MTVTVDFETTGLIPGRDEILQVSIIDDRYRILLNTFCKPIRRKSWKSAEKVNGITPDSVYNELPFEFFKPNAADLLTHADKIIAYNADFEKRFLKAYGINITHDKWIDPMLIFSNIHKDKEKHEFKLQSLKKCAAYYGYKFNAHDSLEDVKATLYCYEQMKKELMIVG